MDCGRDSHVPHGTELLAFTDAIVTGDEAKLADSRARLVAAAGPDGMLDAAGVASNFERMVRIADPTGIELGDFLATATASARQTLGLGSSSSRSASWVTRRRRAP
jgi:hypothetical protein